MDEFNISDFHSPAKNVAHKKYSTYGFSRKPNQESKPSKLIMKICASSAICILALGFSIIRAPLTDKVTENIKTVLSYEMNIDDTLGKLRFVDKDNVMSVFKTNKGTFAMPVSGRPISDEESGRVSFIASKSEDVFACEQGIISAIGEDLSGSYLQINHGNGLETSYYGLVDICVETDQPVKKGDAIARTGYDGVISIKVSQNGKPIIPEFSIGK